MFSVLSKSMDRDSAQKQITCFRSLSTSKNYHMSHFWYLLSTIVFIFQFLNSNIYCFSLFILFLVSLFYLFKKIFFHVSTLVWYFQPPHPVHDNVNSNVQKWSRSNISGSPQNFFNNSLDPLLHPLYFISILECHDPTMSNIQKSQL